MSINISNGWAQQSDKQAIEECIRSFAKAGDQQDAVVLETHLDEHFRIVMNQLFGSEGVSVLTRSDYLDKIRKKEFGGDKRKVTVSELVLNEKTASCKVIFEGEKMSFSSIMVLVKHSDNDWKLVSETPVVKN